jgi:hypothetical protein
MSGIPRERWSVSIEGELTIAKKQRRRGRYQHERKGNQKIFPDGFHA